MPDVAAITVRCNATVLFLLPLGAHPTSVDASCDIYDGGVTDFFVW